MEPGLLEVIPVIDLRGGFVVAARGDLPRDRYPLLRSALCPDAAPQTLLERLESSSAIRTVYIADLDALSQHPPQYALITELARAHPDLRFWVDAGFSDVDSLAALPLLHNLAPVIGSETWCDTAPDSALLARCVPSFDYRDATPAGAGRMTLVDDHPPDMHAIVMCLNRIGQPDGPDFTRLAEARSHHPRVGWFLAGGIRHQADLQKAQACGARGVLVASAIHRGDIPLA
jgi:phosphoribosylformimino-5-aminoimidazole carboxamide ribotide isomerase